MRGWRPGRGFQGTEAPKLGGGCWEREGATLGTETTPGGGFTSSRRRLTLFSGLGPWVGLPWAWLASAVFSATLFPSPPTRRSLGEEGANADVLSQGKGGGAAGRASSRAVGGPGSEQDAAWAQASPLPPTLPASLPALPLCRGSAHPEGQAASSGPRRAPPDSGHHTGLPWQR